MVDQAVQARALDVDQRGQRGAAPPSSLHRVEQIDRLTALAQADHQAAGVEEIGQVAELRADDRVRLARGEAREQILAALGGVRRRAAADQVHGARVRDGARQLLGIVDALDGQATQHARLLVDLLQHVVRVALELGELFLPLDVPDAGISLASAAFDVVELDAVGAQQGRLAVLDEREPTRVLEQRRRVAAQKVAVVAPAQHERRAILGRGDALRLGIEHADRAQAFELAEGAHQRVDQVFLARWRIVRLLQLVLEQVAHDFGVGLRLEPMAARRPGRASAPRGFR